jgi:hypothetical protein
MLRPARLCEAICSATLKRQTDFSEMLAARFITKGIGDFVQIEAAIDNWLDVGSVDCSHEIHLMPPAANDQALEPRLFGH